MNNLLKEFKKIEHCYSVSERQVFSAIIDQCGYYTDLTLSDFKYETRLVDDLFSDSLDLVEIIMAVEERTGIDIDDTSADSFQTIGDIIKYIETKKSEQNG